jgi:hypothetical protein
MICFLFSGSMFNRLFFCVGKCDTFTKLSHMQLNRGQVHEDGKVLLKREQESLLSWQVRWDRGAKSAYWSTALREAVNTLDRPLLQECIAYINAIINDNVDAIAGMLTPQARLTPYSIIGW